MVLQEIHVLGTEKDLFKMKSVEVVENKESIKTGEKLTRKKR